MEPKRLICVFCPNMGQVGILSMRHERLYSRRQRAVTFAGATRTVTIPLEVADFELLEELAAKHNVGNATLGRQIIRKYLRQEGVKETN
jgi:hypothetical protein